MEISTGSRNRIKVTGLKTGIYFLLLLPVFFVLHGYTGHFNFVPPGAFLLVLAYAGIAFFIECIFWLLFMNVQKAGIAAFFVMCYFLFFGAIKDKLQAFLPGTFLWRYGFLLPAGFVTIAIIIIWLKKTQKPLYRLVFYLNLLFVILILTDTVLLTGKIIQLKRSSGLSMPADHLTLCDTCHKPDIFFIILDEYAGNKELTGRLHFDNTSFEKELQQKGFHVVKESTSNYNATIFSVASILNMNYLAFGEQQLKGEKYNYAYKAISESRVVKFFAANGYEFYNYSFLNFPGKPAMRSNTFLPNSVRMIVSETLVGRMIQDNPFNISKDSLPYGRNALPVIYNLMHDNNSLLKRTVDLAGQPSAKPRFVYTHLMMPHEPYYYNSKGVLQPENKLLSPGKDSIDQQYVEYLQYCNGIILQMVNDILAKAQHPPVIMLLGDHGYRNNRDTSDRNWCFYNLNAVYYPDKGYDLLPDPLTNVNHFRVVFNQLFRQQLPLLKDSTIYIKE